MSTEEIIKLVIKPRAFAIFKEEGKVEFCEKIIFVFTILEGMTSRRVK